MNPVPTYTTFSFRDYELIPHLLRDSTGRIDFLRLLAAPLVSFPT